MIGTPEATRPFAREVESSASNDIQQPQRAIPVTRVVHIADSDIVVHFQFQNFTPYCLPQPVTERKYARGYIPQLVETFKSSVIWVTIASITAGWINGLCRPVFPKTANASQPWSQKLKEGARCLVRQGMRRE